MKGGNPMDIRAKIKRLMDARGWTEYRLAKEAGLSQSTVSHLFKRENAPTFFTVESICKAFGISLAQFFAEADEVDSFTEEQRAVLLLWGALDEEQRKVVRYIMKSFAK